YELRAIMEPLALKKSIYNFTKEDIVTLKSYHKIMGETDSEDVYIELNSKFHQLLVCQCDSDRILRFIETISRGFPQDTPQIIPEQISKSNQEHEKILNAIIEEDSEKASQLLAQHIQRTGDELIAEMENKHFN